jgi:hypothetical protein
LQFRGAARIRADKHAFSPSAGGKSRRVCFGHDFGDVAHGVGVAFPRTERVILIVINYGKAATTAGLKSGDELTVRIASGPLFPHPVAPRAPPVGHMSSFTRPIPPPPRRSVN